MATSEKSKRQPGSQRAATAHRAGLPPAHIDGRRAEDAVADWLLERGLTITDRNLRLGYLEIDIVAIDGPVAVIVEVRTRGKGARQTSLGSISKLKRRRLRWAGERLWKRRFVHDARIERVRFDVAAVCFRPSGPDVEYVVAAF